MSMGCGVNWMPGKVQLIFRVMATAAKIVRPCTDICLNPECRDFLTPEFVRPPFLCHNCLYLWQHGDLTLLVNEAQIIGYPDEFSQEDFPSLRILVAAQGYELITVSFS